MPGKAGIRFEIDGDLGQGQRMAERDQIMRLLGRHDRGDPGRREDIAFLGVARKARSSVAFCMTILPFGDRDALGRRLARNIDHIGLPRGGKMGEFRHGGHSNSSRGGSSRTTQSALRFAAARLRLAEQKRPRRRRDVPMAHQAFADKNGRDPMRLQAETILMRNDAAFANDDPVVRDFRGESFAHIRARLRRSANRDC